MMISVLFSLVLFSELNRHLVTVAMPATKLEDGSSDQGVVGLLLRDEVMSERAVVPPLYRQSLVLDNVKDEDGSPKIIVSDMRLRGHSMRGLNSAFTRNLPLLTDQSLSHTPAEYTLKIDRRDTDLDMLRCMIGRVYRPCWEA
ncbi:pro-MCH [Channa argus]|uniref:pro-MCH n=1 Tax=Channa argus TaxID=215402 RepID=UPI003521AF10